MQKERSYLFINTKTKLELAAVKAQYCLDAGKNLSWDEFFDLFIHRV